MSFSRLRFWKEFLKVSKMVLRSEIAKIACSTFNLNTIKAFDDLLWAGQLSVALVC